MLGVEVLLVVELDGDELRNVSGEGGQRVETNLAEIEELRDIWDDEEDERYEEVEEERLGVEVTEGVGERLWFRDWAVEEFLVVE